MVSVPSVTRSAALALLCVPAMAAADGPEPDPAAYTRAFSETCRAGFPDLDAVARAAAARGWVQRSAASVAMIGSHRVSIPQAFNKDGVMLFLDRAGIGAYGATCQVTGTATTRLSGRDVAAVVGPALNAGAGTPGPGDYKKDDKASWDLGGGVTVLAGVNVYKGRTRTLSILMRQAASAGEAPLGASLVKLSDDDVSMVAIGLPFAPEEPTPVDRSHPLFRDVAVADIADLPSTVKSSAMNFIAAAKGSSINAALRETMRQMNMLAPGNGRKRLQVTWLGGRTPFHIGTRNESSVTFRYRLERVDTGQALFEREITTRATGSGGNGAMRVNGIMRAAIAANFASAANCLDRAAFGTAPEDCALTPRFGVTAVQISR
jgi:hypothetical protein